MAYWKSCRLISHWSTFFFSSMLNSVLNSYMTIVELSLSVVYMLLSVRLNSSSVIVCSLKSIWGDFCTYLCVFSAYLRHMVNQKDDAACWCVADNVTPHQCDFSPVTENKQLNMWTLFNSLNCTMSWQWQQWKSTSCRSFCWTSQFAEDTFIIFHNVSVRANACLSIFVFTVLTKQHRPAALLIISENVILPLHEKPLKSQLSVTGLHLSSPLDWFITWKVWYTCIYFNSSALLLLLSSRCLCTLLSLTDVYCYAVGLHPRRNLVVITK